MKNFLKLGLGATLKRIFGNENSARQATPVLQTRAQLGEDKLEIKVEAESPVMLEIWTVERSRYSAARALCTEVEVYPSEAITLCEDIKGYVFDTPSGESVVVEARTGSLVGHTLEVVKDGIREMTRVQLNSQLDTGKKEFNRMKKQPLSNDEFWKAIKMGSNDLDISQDYPE
jgi:hypothetical protein